MKKNLWFFLNIFIRECAGQSDLTFHWINAKLVRFNLINSNYVFPCNGLPLTPIDSHVTLHYTMGPQTTVSSHQNIFPIKIATGDRGIYFSTSLRNASFLFLWNIVLHCNFYVLTFLIKKFLPLFLFLKDWIQYFPDL